MDYSIFYRNTGVRSVKVINNTSNIQVCSSIKKKESGISWALKVLEQKIKEYKGGS